MCAVTNMFEDNDFLPVVWFSMGYFHWTDNDYGKEPQMWDNMVQPTEYHVDNITKEFSYL